MLTDKQARDLIHQIPASPALDALQDHIEEIEVKLAIAHDLIQEIREDLAWFDTCYNPAENEEV